MSQPPIEPPIRTDIPNTTAIGTTGNFTNQDVNGLLTGTAWATTSLTYSFPTAPSNYGSGYGEGEPYSGFHSFSPAQENVVRYSLNLISQYTLLTFTEIAETDKIHATLRFADSSVPATSHAYLPAPGEGGDVWLGNVAYVTPRKGGYAFGSILHETGHALGLKHGHDVELDHGVVPPAHDSTEWSMMNYYSYVGAEEGYGNSPGNGPQTFMIDDIAALQYIYGANFSSNAGNTVYTWSPTTGEMFIDGAGQGAARVNKIYEAVWDGNGIDTYNLSNYTTNLHVDLRPGEWSSFSPAQLADLDDENPGTHMAAGEVANAYLYNNDPRSLIENAIGGSGNDTLTGNQAANMLQGGAGNDALAGGVGNDTLRGDAGNDALNGGTGNDVIDGGQGTDTASYADATAGVKVSLYLQGAAQNTIGAGSDTLINIENLIGSAFDDRLTGDGHANVLSGLAGNDVLVGGAVDDTLIGGAGNDRLTGSFGNDMLTGGAGNDFLDGGAAGSDTASYSDATGAVTVTLLHPGTTQNTVGAGNDTLANLENLSGSAFNDTLTGDSNANMLNGLAGNDLLTGGAGADMLTGLTGNDRLNGGAGNDTVIGGLGNDVMDGGAAGSDTASYADATAAVTVSLLRQGSAQNTVGAGSDSLTNFENLSGSASNDTLTGDTKANILNGLSGNDLLTGNAGNDTLVGAAGNDTLFGNAGVDSFYFDAGFGRDTIADFTATGSGHDVINFSPAVFASYAAVHSHMAQVGPNVVITLDASDVVTLKGVTMASLTAADFNFHASTSWPDHGTHFNALI